MRKCRQQDGQHGTHHLGAGGHLTHSNGLNGGVDDGVDGRVNGGVDGGVDGAVDGGMDGVL